MKPPYAIYIKDLIAEEKSKIILRPGVCQMSGFTVFQDSYIGATIVSNRFIDEYMTEANDAQSRRYSRQI